MKEEEIKRKRLKTNPKKREAGRREDMVARGKKGGRPRALTLEQIRQQQLLEAQKNKKEVMDTPSKLPGSLKELKGLYLRQRRSTGKIKYKPGESQPQLSPKGGKNQ